MYLSQLIFLIEEAVQLPSLETVDNQIWFVHAVVYYLVMKHRWILKTMVIIQ